MRRRANSDNYTIRTCLQNATSLANLHEESFKIRSKTNTFVRIKRRKTGCRMGRERQSWDGESIPSQAAPQTWSPWMTSSAGIEATVLRPSHNSPVWTKKVKLEVKDFLEPYSSEFKGTQWLHMRGTSSPGLL